MIESIPATQAESKPEKWPWPCLARNRVLSGQYKVQPEFLILQTHTEILLTDTAAFSSIHTSVRGEQFTSLKTQFSSPPNTSSAYCNYTGVTAVLPGVHGKFQWCWQHLPTRIGVHLNILSDLKLCVRVAHCFFLNGVLIQEPISCVSDSPEDQGDDKLWTTELLKQSK